MEYTRDESGEPLTPAGRVFLQKDTPQVVYFAVGMKHDIDVQAVKEAIKHSIMLKHPRFSSLLVRTPCGVELWRKTDIEIDRHFIVIDSPGPNDNDDDEAAVNAYLADMSLCSSALDERKPLWEIHVLKAHKCMVFRIHHALGDGISLVSMLQALCGRPDNNPDTLPTMISRTPPRWSLDLAAKLVNRVWLSLVFIVRFTLRSLWVKDRKNPISGGDGVELWPRKLSTARFKLDDMNLVKKVVPGATINDVLIGVISAGLHRYLDGKWTGSMQSGMQITGIAAVNLRKQPGLHDIVKLQWGNLFGIMLLPLDYSSTTSNHNPLDHITKAKEMMDRKKGSFEAVLTYWIGDLVTSWFGSNVMSKILKRVFCNTTFTISNIVGPKERIAFLGNPIKYIRANVSSLPHSLTMHMVSYAGWADLQIMVAKDIIPDPNFLAECFEGALMDIKLAVSKSNLKEE